MDSHPEGGEYASKKIYRRRKSREHAQICVRMFFGVYFPPADMVLLEPFTLNSVFLVSYFTEIGVFLQCGKLSFAVCI